MVQIQALNPKGDKTDSNYLPEEGWVWVLGGTKWLFSPGEVMYFPANGQSICSIHFNKLSFDVQ